MRAIGIDLQHEPPQDETHKPLVLAVAAHGQSEGALYTMAGSMGALAVVMVFLVTRALRVRGDLKLLAGLRGRYRGVFDDRHDLAGLQAAAREVYEEVRVVGGELG